MNCTKDVHQTETCGPGQLQRVVNPPVRVAGTPRGRCCTKTMRLASPCHTAPWKALDGINNPLEWASSCQAEVGAQDNDDDENADGGQQEPRHHQRYHGRDSLASATGGAERVAGGERRTEGS